MNGFATTDELTRKDGETVVFLTFLLVPVCVCVCVRGRRAFSNLMSYVNGRCEAERGGACSVESCQQDC